MASVTPFEQAARGSIATRLAAPTRENYTRALDTWLARGPGATHCRRGRRFP